MVREAFLLIAVLLALHSSSGYAQIVSPVLVQQPGGYVSQGTVAVYSAKPATGGQLSGGEIAVICLVVLAVCIILAILIYGLATNDGSDENINSKDVIVNLKRTNLARDKFIITSDSSTGEDETRRGDEQVGITAFVAANPWLEMRRNDKTTHFHIPSGTMHKYNSTEHLIRMKSIGSEASVPTLTCKQPHCGSGKTGMQPGSKVSDIVEGKSSRRICRKIPIFVWVCVIFGKLLCLESANAISFTSTNNILINQPVQKAMVMISIPYPAAESYSGLKIVDIHCNNTVCVDRRIKGSFETRYTGDADTLVAFNINPEIYDEEGNYISRNDTLMTNLTCMQYTSEILASCKNSSLHPGLSVAIKGVTPYIGMMMGNATVYVNLTVENMYRKETASPAKLPVMAATNTQTKGIPDAYKEYIDSLDGKVVYNETVAMTKAELAKLLMPFSKVMCDDLICDLNKLGDCVRTQGKGNLKDLSDPRVKANIAVTECLQEQLYNVHQSRVRRGPVHTFSHEGKNCFCDYLNAWTCNFYACIPPDMTSSVLQLQEITRALNDYIIQLRTTVANEVSALWINSGRVEMKASSAMLIGGSALSASMINAAQDKILHTRIDVSNRITSRKIELGNWERVTTDQCRIINGGGKTTMLGSILPHLNNELSQNLTLDQYLFLGKFLCLKDYGREESDILITWTGKTGAIFSDCSVTYKPAYTYSDPNGACREQELGMSINCDRYTLKGLTVDDVKMRMMQTPMTEIIRNPIWVNNGAPVQPMLAMLDETLPSTQSYCPPVVLYTYDDLIILHSSINCVSNGINIERGISAVRRSEDIILRCDNDEFRFSRVVPQMNFTITAKLDKLLSSQISVMDREFKIMDQTTDLVQLQQSIVAANNEILNNTMSQVTRVQEEARLANQEQSSKMKAMQDELTRRVNEAISSAGSTGSFGSAALGVAITALIVALAFPLIVSFLIVPNVGTEVSDKNKGEKFVCLPVEFFNMNLKNHCVLTSDAKVVTVGESNSVWISYVSRCKKDMHSFFAYIFTFGSKYVAFIGDSDDYASISQYYEGKTIEAVSLMLLGKVAKSSAPVPVEDSTPEVIVVDEEDETRGGPLNKTLSNGQVIHYNSNGWKLGDRIFLQKAVPIPNCVLHLKGTRILTPENVTVFEAASEL